MHQQSMQFGEGLWLGVLLDKNPAYFVNIKAFFACHGLMIIKTFG